MMAMIANLWRVKAKSKDSLQSWIALFAATSIAVCSVGFINIFSICYNALLDKFGESKEKTAWIGSIPSSLMFLLGPFSSWLVNKLGLRMSTMCAAIPVAASLLLTSFMKDLDYIFITFSVPFGLGSSILLVSSVKVVCIYFDKWLSLAYGVSTGCVAISLVGLSYLMIGLLDKFGLEKAFRILSAMFFVICLVAAQAFLPTDFPKDGKHGEDEAKRKKVAIYVKLLKNKPLCIFLLANFTYSFSYAVSYVHQVRLALNKGVSENIAKQFPVFTSISVGLGRIFCGIVFDLKVKNKMVFMQITMLLAGLTCFAGLFTTNQTHLIIYIWVFGALDGIVQAAVTPALRTTVGLNFLSEAYSLILTADAIALLLGPPLVGFIVDKTSNYDAFFYITGTPYILAFLELFLLRCFQNESTARSKEKSEFKTSLLANWWRDVPTPLTVLYCPLTPLQNIAPFKVEGGAVTPRKTVTPR